MDIIYIYLLHLLETMPYHTIPSNAKLPQKTLCADGSTTPIIWSLKFDRKYVHMFFSKAAKLLKPISSYVLRPINMKVATKHHQTFLHNQVGFLKYHKWAHSASQYLTVNHKFSLNKSLMLMKNHGRRLNFRLLSIKTQFSQVYPHVNIWHHQLEHL